MTFEDILEGKTIKVKESCYCLRQLILECSDLITENIHGGAKVKLVSYYIGSNYNVVAVISPSKDHCQLYLHHFDKIELHGLKLNGKGKHSRHLKIYDIDNIDVDIIKKVLLQITTIALVKSNS